jgi:TonB-linked SusC/RagA family outer membrane protein
MTGNQNLISGIIGKWGNFMKKTNTTKARFREMLFMLFMVSVMGMQLVVTDLANAQKLYAQNSETSAIRLNVKNMSLVELFKKIESKTTFVFSYSESVARIKTNFTFKYDSITLPRILLLIKDKVSLNFKVFDNTIAVQKRKNGIKNSEGVNVTEVTGRVTDKNGEPLPGVNIRTKGGTTGTATDSNGRYEINVPDESTTLIFSFIGYVTQEVQLNNRNEINITLISNTRLLSEIVVSAIGTKENLDESGSTVSSISTESISKSGSNTLINSLAGKASGVSIQKTSGDPGSGSTIQVRGANTMLGSSQPLVILDGVPISNDNIGDVTISQQSRLNDINSSDIESVQILKGASAAALWGSRAANGVMVITTNNGSLGGAPTVNYSVTQSFDEINLRTPIQNTFGRGSDGVWSRDFRESWGDKISDRPGGEDVVDETGEYFISQGGKRYYPILEKNSRETFIQSNYDQVFQTGTSTEQNLSIGGGGDNYSYYLGLGNLGQEGIIRNYTYDQKNVKLNTQVQFTNWFTWNNNVTYTNTESNRIIQAGENTNGILLGLLRTPPDFDQTDYIGTYVSGDGDAFPLRHRAFRRPLGGGVNPIYNNPLWTLNEQKAGNNVDRFIVSPEFQMNPLQWLDITLRGSIDYYTDTRDNFYPVGSASGTRSGGYYDRFDITNRDFNFDLIVRASRSISQNIDITGTLGANYNDRRQIFNTNVLTSFAVNARLQTDDLNPDQASSTWDRNIREIRSTRGFGIAAFDFYDQLFVELSGAVEAASTVKDNFFYPSAEAAWQFSENISSEVLSFGKLRASWGKVGTQPAPYKFNTLATTAFSSFGGSYAVDSEQGDPNLEPEIKTEWEAGTDLRFFEDRTALDITYYQNETTGILFPIQLPSSTGFSTKYTNGAVIENKGIEVDFDTRIIDSKGFQISLNSNFNKNKNEVTDIDGSTTVDLGGTSKAVEGFPMGALFLPGTLRNDDGSLALDANGFPQLDTERRVVGDPNPDWRGGLGMQLNWKGLDFNFLFERSQGGEIINRTRGVLYGFGVHEDVANEVTLEEDVVNVNGEVFNVGTTLRGNLEDFGDGSVLLDEAWYQGIGGGLGFNQVNDLYVEDATWTKLRNVTLGYTFTNLNVFNSATINSFRLSVTGRDLFLWTNVQDVDPEVSNYGVSNISGLNYFNNPGTRSVLFNFEVNF